ncbi:unnamed protein product [Orchesella dallaii]|uniref:Gustatory receptor n=1 Tax=Orchesella dallaii TaxID=48710 RepID=A0ABP1PU06_9HEXA
MPSITQKNGNIPLIQLLGDVTLAILDKYSYIQDKIWVKTPIRWISHLRRVKPRQSVKEVLPWMIIQIIHGLLVVYELLLITGYGGIPVEELKSWFKIFIVFLCILDVTISVITFTLWSKRDLMAACFNAVTLLPKYQSEVPLESGLANTKAASVISHLVSAGLTLELALSPYALSFVVVVFNLEDPTLYLLRPLTFMLSFQLDQAMRAFILTLLNCNRFFSLINYAFLLIMLASRILLVQLTILQPPNAKTSRPNSFMATFDRKLGVYRRLYLILKYCNEMGGLTHSLIMTMGFFTMVISGSVVVLKTSFLSIPTSFFPMFPSYFLLVLGLFIASVPIAANIYENSVWFKYAWMKTGGYERKYVRKQLVSCSDIKAKLGVMGFVDRSYIMTFLDALLNNIVNVVMYVSETRLQVLY